MNKAEPGGMHVPRAQASRTRLWTIGSARVNRRCTTWMAGTLVSCLLATGFAAWAQQEVKLAGVTLAVPEIEGDLWLKAERQADTRIAKFMADWRSGNPARMRRAALDVQADPVAVSRLNRMPNDPLKHAMNTAIGDVQADTRARIKQAMAERFKIDPERISFFEATNPSSGPKVGQDWDLTIRVDDRDVPSRIAEKFAHEAYYESVTGHRAPSTTAARKLAERQCLEVTHYMHPEAYGGAMSEGSAIIRDHSGAMRDPRQVSQAISHKSDLACNRARELLGEGRPVDAEGFRLEQYRQATKQYDKQVRTRVAALAKEAGEQGRIAQKIQTGMEVLRGVEDGRWSPSQAKAMLRQLDPKLTPDILIQQSADLVEGAQNLRPGAMGLNGGRPDAVAENVLARLRARRAHGGTDPPWMRRSRPHRGPCASSFAESAKSGGGLSKSGLAKKGVGALTALLMIYDAGVITGEGVEALDRYLQAIRDKDVQAAKVAMEDMKTVGGNAALTTAVGALCAKVPMAQIALLSGVATRAALAYTGADEWVDEGATETIVQIGERSCNFWDDIGGVFGWQTRFDKERLERQARVDAYRSAIERGAMQLLPGIDEEAFLFIVATSEPTDPEFRAIRDLLLVPADNPYYKLLDPDLTDAERRRLLAEFDRRPGGTEGMEGRGAARGVELLVAQSLRTVSGALEALREGARPLTSSGADDPVFVKAEEAGRGLEEQKQKLEDACSDVDGQITRVLASLEKAGEWPAAKPHLLRAINQLMQAAVAYGKVRRAHRTLSKSYWAIAEAADRYAQLRDLCRQIGAAEEALLDACEKERDSLEKLRAAVPDPALRSRLEAGIASVLRVQIETAQVRDQAMEALEGIHGRLALFETMDPSVDKIMQQAEELRRRTDDSFDAVLFTVGLRAARLAEELEEQRRVLERRAEQRTEREERIRYLEDHEGRRVRILARPNILRRDRERLTAELNKIRGELSENRNLVAEIRQDEKERDEKVKELLEELELLARLAKAAERSAAEG